MSPFLIAIIVFYVIYIALFAYGLWTAPIEDDEDNEVIK